MRSLTEIECSFFGCIFDDPESRILEAKREAASPDWFEDPECRLCWVAIESIYDKKSIKDIDFITIFQEASRLSEIKGSDEYGIEIKGDFYDKCIHYRQGATAEERSDIHSYSEILRGNAMRRKILKSVNASIERMQTSADPMAEGSRLSNEVTTIMKDGSPTKEISIRDLTDDALQTYDTAYQEFAVKKNYDFVSGIQMPWKYLSKVMNGLQPGLHIVAARPSVGKTSFVLQCAMFWAEEGYKVAFDCLDMAARQVIRRPLANLSRVAIDKAERGMASQEELQTIREKKDIVDGWGDNGNFQVLCEYDVGKLKTWCTIAHAAGMLDIMIIDYVQQLRCYGTGNRSENDRLTAISSVLKSIAIELNIPVIALSQLSRDNVKDKNGARTPTMADLRGSGSLEQDAFSVTLLYFDDDVKTFWRDGHPPINLLVPTSSDLEVIDEEVKAVRPIWWDFQKNQNGSTGKCPFVVYNNHFRWYEGFRGGRDSPVPGGPTYSGLFSRITADWRFDEEPLLSLSKKGMVEYPKYWEYQVARLCKRRGKDVPDSIQAKLTRNFQDSLSQGTLEPAKETVKDNVQPVANDDVKPVTPVKLEAKPKPSGIAQYPHGNTWESDGGLAETERKMMEMQKAQLESSDEQFDNMPDDSIDPDMEF